MLAWQGTLLFSGYMLAIFAQTLPGHVPFNHKEGVIQPKGQHVTKDCIKVTINMTCTKVYSLLMCANDCLAAFDGYKAFL